MSAKQPNALPSVTDDGRLHVPAHTTVYLPDEPTEPGTVMATTYNHATTVHVTEFRPITGKDFALAYWGARKARRAVRITLDDMLQIQTLQD